MTTADTAKLARYLGFLAQDPDNSKLLVDTVELAIACQQFEKAETLIDHGLVRWPAHPGLCHQRGLLALRQGNATAAAALFQSLIDMGYQIPAVRYNLAYAQYLQGDFDATKALLEPMLQENDAVPGFLYLLVLSLHQLGELEQASSVAEAALLQSPDDAELAGLLSMVYLDDDNIDGAMRWAAYSLARLPDQHYALVTMGTAQMGLGKMDEAIVKFQHVLDLNPINGRAWSGLAIARFYQKDFVAAEHAFLKATEYLSTHIGTWHAYGWMCLLQGRLDDAERCFQRGLDLDRNFGESYGAMAAIALLRGQVEAAEPLLVKARRLAPEGLSARYAELLQAQSSGNQSEVERIINGVLATMPLAKNFPSLFEAKK
ncbi:tetratricopeptide repeat protein [Chitinimonas sp. PSY-7]|uniref:tetratricopeptide repeat protein n=1 Tax=Chitinimonas sp. PSY-7 TaxID=3459088 RepID=UPI0040400F94